ncbi:indole-3-glycerol phosphate synthase TrpC [Planctomicrobium piriforme]|uniref:Indole-3-glycerol phosphate synthase n=1 Tax=Planctomicrobium piriforme TaxID=1576369 RepID=A0A1I3N5P8_9PLAN|nr:indole-3-glycerol phosphate synthase TrpC [Planctomicrobium piriforme]SFJ04603.1 indole-3-glycerol phosphate synthase [Planctomicrobium piriforme]
MSNVLERIIVQKRLDIAAARQLRSEQELQSAIRHAPAPRDFAGALRARHPMGLIAEVKKASPSAGLIREDFEPVEIARAYADNGAACISVLTDEHFFQGHLSYLEQIRQAVDIPVLRKDFIIEPYQVWEARASGADCILLIAECLNDAQLAELYALAAELGMQALVEVYEPANVDRVLKLNPPMLGVNNRDLRSFVTDLQHTVRLRQQIPADVLVIGESGIHTRQHVEMLASAGVHGILVGESLMRAPDIGAAVCHLLGGAAKPH